MALAMCAPMVLWSAAAPGDDEAKEEKTLVFRSSLVAIDGRMILVRSHLVGRESALPKLSAAADSSAKGKPIPADASVAVRRKIEVLADDATHRKVKVTWQKIDLDVPPTAKNFALVTEGAEFSASSTAGKITLGQQKDRNARMESIQLRWRDKTIGQYPDWLAVKFPQPRQIDTVILRTFGEHVHGRNKEGIRDYQLQYRTSGGNWTTLASVRNNTKEYLVHRFPPVITDQLRVQVTAGNVHDEIGWRTEGCRSRSGNSRFSRLQDFEVFKLGPQPVNRVEELSRTVTIEKSAKGCIAVFKDEVPMPEGVASSPDYLAEVLRQAGYGVTFLDAELLSNTSLLAKENFDLFIHPYGCSFPLGTTLYQFLEQGGHLLTLGGQAFTNVVVRSADGKLLATGYDPGIITTPAKMVRKDWYAPLREQIGLFAGPFQTFVQVASARAVSGQHIINPAIRINGPLEGYPSTGLVGQVIPIEEEEQYVQEGKEMTYILNSRVGTKKIGAMHRLNANYNYFMFNKTCARWVPLLEAHDLYDRPRGSAGAMILNHDGRYRGSIWTFFGATNRDLFPPGDETMGKALLNIVGFAMRGTFLHGLRPGYNCYRQGERAAARVFVENFGSADRTGRVTFTFLPLKSEEVAFKQEQEIRLPKEKSTLVETSWARAATTCTASDSMARSRWRGCGEFYWWAARYGDDAAHRFYLDFPHLYFAMGYSWMLNWE